MRETFEPEAASASTDSQYVARAFVYGRWVSLILRQIMANNDSLWPHAEQG
mgnify:CR=1 FL=1